jgi:hypothetical protein
MAFVIHNEGWRAGQHAPCQRLNAANLNVLIRIISWVNTLQDAVPDAIFVKRGTGLVHKRNAIHEE